MVVEDTQTFQHIARFLSRFFCAELFSSGLKATKVLTLREL